MPYSIGRDQPAEGRMSPHVLVLTDFWYKSVTFPRLGKVGHRPLPQCFAAEHLDARHGMYRKALRCSWAHRGARVGLARWLLRRSPVWPAAGILFPKRRTIL